MRKTILALLTLMKVEGSKQNHGVNHPVLTCLLEAKSLLFEDVK